MRKHKRKNEYSRLEVPHIIKPTHQRAAGNLSDTTAPPSTDQYKKWKTKTEKTFSLSIESHITIRPKVELSRKRVSLLLEQEIVRVSSEGFSLLDYFGFEWMLTYLVGSRSLHDIGGKKMSTVIYCANLILLAYKEISLNLLYKPTPIHPKLHSFVEENFGILTDRKYQSRRLLYQIDKFLQVKIEDVNSIFERSQNSVRYSSYCKGYGEGGRSVRKQATRYSYELDRDDSEVPQEEFYSFSDTIHYQEDLYYLEQSLREEKKA